MACNITLMVIHISLMAHYVAASILISFGCGIIFREKNMKNRVDDLFSFAAFFISIGLLTIVGLVLFKFNILC